MIGELLIELFSEEIPARMQQRAAEDLARLASEALTKANLAFTETKSYATPRRLALVVKGLPRTQPDTREERKGPRVGSPEQAIQGFLRAAGLASLEQCEKRNDGKAEFWYAVSEKPGAPTREVLLTLLPDVLAALPWPKSMRWADRPLRWVRPLHSILCLFEGQAVPFKFGHLTAGDTTCGHRFLAPKRFAVRDANDWLRSLRGAYVEPDFSERRALVLKDAAFAAANEKLALIEDAGLADEVAGLVEHPVVLLGAIPPQFMDVPREVLTTAMRTHQKYFALNDAAGKLAPRFVIVANMLTDDGGRQVVAGNERVLAARLSDAKFFWDQDRKQTLESRLGALADIVFHARLGTLLQKSRRIKRLAFVIAEQIGAAPAKARRAAKLAKADLVTGVVGEFPELQGIMGRYYALNDGEDPALADAVALHYAPQGPNDRCPSEPIAIAAALADKLDTLTGFFAIDEKPTGSKDPFALRRAALGVIRIVLENGLSLPLRPLIERALSLQAVEPEAGRDVPAELLRFFVDRLKVHLREAGVRHDVIAAVFARGNDDDLLRIRAKAEALAAFLASAEGGNLLTAYRRAANIVRAELKKDGHLTLGDFREDLAGEPAEIGLYAALNPILASSMYRLLASGEVLDAAEFGRFLAAFAHLRPALDAFFENVTVNAEDAAVRQNRLSLLRRVAECLDHVADFSQIEG